MLTRRSFLGAVGAAVAAVALPVKSAFVWTKEKAWNVRGPDIVVRAGETLRLMPGNYGWIQVYGRLYSDNAAIRRLDIMEGGCVGFSGGAWATRIDNWSEVATPRLGDFIIS